MPNRDSRICQSCSFETARLGVLEWHSSAPGADKPLDLTRIVSEMLTEPVTRSLPEYWRGEYSIDRARTWIEDRDREGTTLLVVERKTSAVIGLIILFETEVAADPGDIEVRLGYLLSESAWGKGFASEMIDGFVGWCRGQARISTVIGGVERGNTASRRVLEKNGFHPVASEAGSHHEEEFLRLTLRK